MTTAHDIDWPQVLAERLTTTHPDVLRDLLSMTGFSRWMQHRLVGVRVVAR